MGCLHIDGGTVSFFISSGSGSGALSSCAGGGLVSLDSSPLKK